MESAKAQLAKLKRRSVKQEIVLPSTMEGVIDSLFDLLMHKTGLHINEAIQLFSLLDVSSFESIVQRFHATGDFDSRQTLIYYLTLFRKEPKVKILMEHASLPLEFIESIVLSTVVRTNLNDADEHKALDELLDTLPHKTQYELVSKTKFLSRDPILVYYLLAKLDKAHLDLYFSEPENTTKFVIGICNLPEKMIRTIFFKNPELHGFYMMFYETVDLSMYPKAHDYCQIDLTEVEKTKKLAIEVAAKFKVSSELKIPLPRRNKDRFVYIISRIRYLPDISTVLASLEKEGVIDTQENSLLFEIVTNPLYGDVLNKFTLPVQETREIDEFIF